MKSKFHLFVKVRMGEALSLCYPFYLETGPLFTAMLLLTSFHWDTLCIKDTYDRNGEYEDMVVITVWPETSGTSTSIGMMAIVDRTSMWISHAPWRSSRVIHLQGLQDSPRDIRRKLSRGTVKLEAKCSCIRYLN